MKSLFVLTSDLGLGLCASGSGFGVWNSGYALHHWRLEGSADGTAWSTLRTYANDAGLAAEPMATASWPLATARSFRHFRIVQTGPNAVGDHQLTCAGIELYGTLRQA